MHRKQLSTPLRWGWDEGNSTLRVWQLTVKRRSLVTLAGPLLDTQGVGQPGWPRIKPYLSVSGASRHPSSMDKGGTDWSATGVPLPPDTTSDSLVRLWSTVTWLILPHSQDLQRNELLWKRLCMFSSWRAIQCIAFKEEKANTCYSCVSVVGKNWQLSTTKIQNMALKLCSLFHQFSFLPLQWAITLQHYCMQPIMFIFETDKPEL